MDTAEVIEREPYSVGGLEVRPLFAESIRQPSHTPHPHADGKVLSFDMGSANPVKFWFSPLWDRHSVNNFGGRVPLFSIAGRGIDFYQLREINPRTQAHVNRVHIGPKAVSCDLESALSGLIDFLSEGDGIAGIPASKVPCQHQLSVPLNGDEAIGIPAHRVAARIVLFLAPDKTPYFVTLNIGHGEIADPASQEPFALLANKNKQGKYRCVVKASKALDRADRASLNEKLNRLGSFFQRGIHAAKWRSMVFCKGLAALITAETLKTVAVFSKFLTAGIAVVTGHYEPCLSSAIGSQWSLKGSSEQSLGLGPAGCYKHPAGLLVNCSFLLIRQLAKSRHIIPTDIDDASVLTDIGSSLTNKSPHTSCPHSRESPDTFPQIRILSIRVDGFQIAFLPCNNGVNTDEQIFGRTSGNALFK